VWRACGFPYGTNLAFTRAIVAAVHKASRARCSPSGRPSCRGYGAKLRRIPKRRLIGAPIFGAGNTTARRISIKRRKMITAILRLPFAVAVRGGSTFEGVVSLASYTTLVPPRNSDASAAFYSACPPISPGPRAPVAPRVLGSFRDAGPSHAELDARHVAFKSTEGSRVHEASGDRHRNRSPQSAPPLCRRADPGSALGKEKTCAQHLMPPRPQ
jgi:hypothetical protein